MPKNGITAQQLCFAVNVASGMTGTEAAIDAGYSPQSAHVAASRLLKNAKVASEIKRISAKQTTAALGSKAELLDKVWQRLVACESDRDFTALSRLWFDASGSMVHKQEIRTDQRVDLVWSAPVADDSEGEGDDS